jgi:hypothetical protein
MLSSGFTLKSKKGRIPHRVVSSPKMSCGGCGGFWVTKSFTDAMDHAILSWAIQVAFLMAFLMAR